MSLRLKKLDDVKVLKYDAQVWQQGNVITVAINLDQVDPLCTNVAFAHYDNRGTSTLEEAIKVLADIVNKVHHCAHVFEAAIVEGRRTNKCKHCAAETK